jgi:hypothetical protein
MATHPEQRFLGKLVLFGFFRTADLGQQCEVVSHEWLANFRLYRHRHFSVITFGVACCFSSQVGLPWFIPSRGVLLCVGPHPKFISGSLLRGSLPAFYYRLEALASAPPPHWRWQHRSRFLPDQRSTRLHPQFQAPLPPTRLDLGVVSLVLVWPVLSAPSARCR